MTLRPSNRPTLSSTVSTLLARPALVLLALSLASGAARAHDIVLVPDKSGLTVRYGHPADWLPVDGEKLLELSVQGADGASTDRHGALKRRGLDLLLGQGSLRGATLVSARYDNGLWVQLPPGADGKAQWRNSSRFLTPSASSVLLSVKFAKAWSATAADDAVFKRQVGHLLELVPQKNPLSLKPGEMLPVRVLFNGKPLVDAGIENSNLVVKLPEDKIPRYRTDANGIAQVPLRANGINTLAVDLERTNDSSLPGGALAAPADKLLAVATFTFVR